MERVGKIYLERVYEYVRASGFTEEDIEVDELVELRLRSKDSPLHKARIVVDSYVGFFLTDLDEDVDIEAFWYREKERYSRVTFDDASLVDFTYNRGQFKLFIPLVVDSGYPLVEVINYGTERLKRDIQHLLDNSAGYRVDNVTIVCKVLTEIPLLIITIN